MQMLRNSMDRCWSEEGAGRCTETALTEASMEREDTQHQFPPTFITLPPSTQLLTIIHHYLSQDLIDLHRLDGRINLGSEVDVGAAIEQLRAVMMGNGIIMEGGTIIEMIDQIRNSDAEGGDRYGSASRKCRGTDTFTYLRILLYSRPACTE